MATRKADMAAPGAPLAKSPKLTNLADLEEELNQLASLGALPAGLWSPEPPMTPLTALFRPAVAQGTKYIVVSGGVCSSLGKGVTTSSIGALLRGEGYRVTAIKMDPYINIDAGLMSPYEHGEVYVLDDGGETDLDLGNYERMMFVSLGRDNNITTGKIYDSVIQKERKGDYLGKTVQVVPHITGAIVEWLDRVAQKPVDATGLRPQICMIELGGTVGDIESMPFIEALRQFKFSLPEDSLAWCHCSYIPDMSGQKTKPTQHSVKALLSLGLQPDLIICRSKDPLQEGTRKKIANQCNIRPNRIISAHDVDNLFHVPRIFAEQKVVTLLTRAAKLDLLELTPPNLFVGDIGLRSLDSWNRFAKQVDEAKRSQPVTIAFVGKYNEGGGDAYQSVLAALEHAAVAMKRKLKVEWIDATDLETGDGSAEAAKARVSAAEARLKAADGVFVPGGFGDRGIEGKARAAGLARAWKKPYLGVCLGMQVAIIQFARDVVGLADATSEEFDKQKESKNHVLIFMPEISRETMGANMRLGQRWVEFPNPETSIGAALYGGASRILERHRHRYEFNVAQANVKGASAEYDKCNGKYRAAGDHNGHKMFKNSNDAIIYFDHGWKMNTLEKTDVFVYSHDGTDEFPPEGQWKATGGDKFCVVDQVIPFKKLLEDKGFIFSAQDESKERMDAIELPFSEHPFYFAVQYHPEYKSRPGQPSPPFYGFVAAACKPGEIQSIIQDARQKGPNAHWTPFQI